MDEKRIVIEVISHPDVARLEARDEELRSEIKRVEGKVDGLHRTIYEILDVIKKLRSKN